MLRSARLVLQYLGAVEREAFLEDTLLQDALIRRLTIVGEAAKRVSAELQAARSEILWSDFARLRDVVVHQYFRVDVELLWIEVHRDLPGAVDRLQQLADALLGDEEELP